jgi:hypothetical protein
VPRFQSTRNSHPVCLPGSRLRIDIFFGDPLYQQQTIATTVIHRCNIRFWEVAFCAASARILLIACTQWRASEGDGDEAQLARTSGRVLERLGKSGNGDGRFFEEDATIGFFAKSTYAAVIF